MTIAIAATFPWGQLRKVATSIPGGSISGGVILATDSRWTFADRPAEDIAQKLWKLAPERGVGVVYAGDVWAAEDALDNAQRAVNSLTSTHPDTVAPIVSEALVNAYRAHQRKRRVVRPLYAMVGMANQQGEGLVIKYSYANDFAPLFVVGLECIGSETACRKVRGELPNIEKALLPRNGGSWSLDITEWALHLVVRVFNAVIGPGEESTVGGGIQVATISPNGWMDLGVDQTSNPDDPEAWEPISADSGKLKRWRKESPS